MSQKNSLNNPILSVLKGNSCRPAPIWLMRQAGRYLPEYLRLRSQKPDFLDFCYSKDLATEATLQPIERFDLDAAILFSDILVICDALGQHVSFVKDKGPLLEPITDLKDLPSTDCDDWRLHLDPVYQAVRQIRQSLPGKKALFGFSGAPWTLACYMIDGKGGHGFPRTRKMAYEAPEKLSSLIDYLCQIVTFHLRWQIDAGADCVQLFDSWAGLLPEKLFHRFCVQSTAEIVQSLKNTHPEIPVIAFPRGAGVLCVPYVQNTAIDAVSLDTTLPLDWIRKNIQTICPVQGNIDPMALSAGGSALDQAALDIWNVLGQGPLIINLGHGVLPDTNPDHVQQLVETIRSVE